MFPDARRKPRSGQAMVEFAMIVIALALLVSVACDFIPIFTAAIRQQSEVADVNILDKNEGVVEKQSTVFETELRIPFLLDDGEDITLSESMKFPAANLSEEPPPDIKFSGSIDQLIYPHEKIRNYSRDSRFNSWIFNGAPDKIKDTISLISPWTRKSIAYANDDIPEYVFIYTIGDTLAPSAVAAVYVGPAKYTEGTGPRTVVTVIARSAGANP